VPSLRNLFAHARAPRRLPSWTLPGGTLRPHEARRNSSPSGAGASDPDSIGPHAPQGDDLVDPPPTVVHSVGGSRSPVGGHAEPRHYRDPSPGSLAGLRPERAAHRARDLRLDGTRSAARSRRQPRHPAPFVREEAKATAPAPQA